MPIDYERLKGWRFDDIEQSYTARDTIRYALGLGLGQDPLDPAQLRHVYEENLVALPTMAMVLASPGFWLREPDTGVDWPKVLRSAATSLCWATAVPNTQHERQHDVAARLAKERDPDDRVPSLPVPRQMRNSTGYIDRSGG